MNERVEQRASRFYDLAFSTEEGLSDIAANPMRVRRVMVREDDSPFNLALVLLLGFDPIRRLRASLGLRARIGRAPVPLVFP